MASTEGILSFSLTSVVEDLMKQQGGRLDDVNLASRKAEEASLRRYEAAGWLRKTVGVVGGKDLPAEPSEEEFRIGLRSGIILCNVLNKIQSGVIPKVVEGPCDSVTVPDGAPLSAFQYFENLRNFLVAVEELGLPTFEASDLEKGGKSVRIVNCVLALKSYSEWKQGGCCGSWKFGGGAKSIASTRHFVRKNSEPFMTSFSKTSVVDSSYCPSSEQNNGLLNDLNEEGSEDSLKSLVRGLLMDKKQDEIPMIVEHLLKKITEVFHHRLVANEKTSASDPLSISAPIGSPSTSNCNDDDKPATSDPISISATSQSPSTPNCNDEDKIETRAPEHEDCAHDQRPKNQYIKRQLFDLQKQHIWELKEAVDNTKENIRFLQFKHAEEFSTLGNQLFGLAHAASSYHKVLEENRKLYNQVQDLKGNIRVYCRVRPFLSSKTNQSTTVAHMDEGNISIIVPSKYGKEGRKLFTFNKVFGPSATQDQVFSDTQPLVRSVLDGYNVCIFAYGQTGSGKTYTMCGPEELTEESMGVNYRALSDLFHISQQRKGTIYYDISVQMIEIYNEQVRDLLVTDGLNKKVEIRNSSANGINVPDANLVPVSSTKDVIDLMNLGHRNRMVGATALNIRSSRSHSCLTVHVKGRDLLSGTLLRGCMHLVDLAGSERVDKSEVTGDRLKESLHINKSLSALGDVIASLSQKNMHVPYRNSKLTQLLQDSLGGQAKSLMFVHISPEVNSLGETISTLKFAERVSSVELGAARVNKDSADVKELKEQISSLKAALARKDGEVDDFSSRCSTPEGTRLKGCGSLPSVRSWQSIGCMSSDSIQHTDDANNLEIQSNSGSLSRRQSLDLQEMVASAPSSVASYTKEDEREDKLGDWVDKIMVNRQEKGSRFEADDVEGAMSDSSETDVLWQLQTPKAMGSQKMKISSKHGKNQETRSMIPTLMPPQPRKTNGVISAPSFKMRRQTSFAEMKRKGVNGK